MKLSHLIFAGLIVTLTGCNQSSEETIETSETTTQTEHTPLMVEGEQEQLDLTADHDMTSHNNTDHDTDTHYEVVQPDSDSSTQSRSISPNNSSNTTTLTAKDSQGSPLQAEIITFLQGLQAISDDTMQQQVEVNQMVEQSSTREDEVALIERSLDVFKSQKQQLASISLNSPELIAIRNKMIDAVDIKIDVVNETKDVTQPSQELQEHMMNKFQQSQMLFNEANQELISVAQAQGIGR